MASFRIDGLSDLLDDLEDIALLSDEVTDKMLNAEADVMVEAEKKTASTMLQGPYYAGGVAESVGKGKTKKADYGEYIDVVFKGTQHGERLAAIAYINEYGKTNQPARPFIMTAIEQDGDRAVDAAAKVYDEYLKSKNL